MKRIFVSSKQFVRHKSDYFALLNVPREFDIDLQQLTLKFRNQQFKFHPDRLVYLKVFIFI